MCKKTSRKAIVFITTRAGFPNGHGATARIMTWANGMYKLGMRPWVVPLRPSESPNIPHLNTEAAGIVDGIRFVYAPGQVRRSTNALGKFILQLKGFIGFISALRTIHRTDGIYAIYYYTPEHPLFIITAALLAKHYKVPLLGERTEAVLEKRRRLKSRIIEQLYRVFDGFVVITQYLHEQIAPWMRKGAPLVTIPIIVDTQAFAPAPTDGDGAIPIVAYCGSLHREVEIERLLQVFTEATRDLPTWKLMVMGRYTDREFELFSGIVDTLGIRERVIWTGGVPRSEMPRYLRQAKVMLLPRASGLFSQAGFPTKLGEYLATGCPVVVTATGDIPKYLVDKQNAYLAPPDDLAAIAKCLRFVITHYEEASIVGQQGRKVALQHFDHLVNCRLLLDIIAQTPRAAYTEAARS